MRQVIQKERQGEMRQGTIEGTNTKIVRHDLIACVVVVGRRILDEAFDRTVRGLCLK